MEEEDHHRLSENILKKMEKRMLLDKEIYIQSNISSKIELQKIENEIKCGIKIPTQKCCEMLAEQICNGNKKWFNELLEDLDFLKLLLDIPNDKDDLVDIIYDYTNSEDLERFLMVDLEELWDFINYLREKEVKPYYIFL